ncbi:MAG: AraC family transcriptional regulator [Victivallaceae bacterium]|nr:AraC family transcriptional regulator [Victivallaceae bacterium]
MEKFSNIRDFIFSGHTVGLHSMLVNAGCQGITGDYNWDGLRRGDREFAIWQYTLAGRGMLRFGRTEYVQEPHSSMLLIVPEDHCYFLPDDSPYWEVLFVTIHGSECIRLAVELRRRLGTPSFPLSPDGRTVQLARKILAWDEPLSVPDRFAASLKAYEFMLTLFSEAEIDPPGSGKQKLFDLLRNYVLEHLDAPISIDDLSAAANMSKRKLEREFRAGGMPPPNQFIADLRMRSALRMLQTTSFSIKEIAVRCGYDSPSYFIRRFHARYRQSPGAFRNL